ncbi:hypothetical protein [Thioflavicoccus mobilis]|nr:hypothetical protein [Thioflavicoccus mobilis]
MGALQVKGPFNISDVGAAPRLPGIYVWYARFAVEEADWNSRYAGSEEMAAVYLMKALKNQFLKYERQEMKVSAATNFSSEWKGTLQEDQLAKWRIGQETDGGADGFGDKLQTCLRDDHSRQALVTMIELAFPLFCAPLYVGKASEQTLRERLKQHKQIYLQLWERYLKDRQFPDRLREPKNFAERAIKLGFAAEDLYCYTLSFDVGADDGLSPSDGTALIEATEWLLNRWATPILGRQ